MKSAAIAFYNTENFFDTIDDPEKLDNEFTAHGSLKWTEKRYRNKVWKITHTISQIGWEETGNPPLFAGLAEIENKTVVRDLIQSENLRDYHYDFIHFDSMDERGIDNTLIYRKEFIQIVAAEAIRQSFVKADGLEDYTRDDLYIKLKFNEELMNVFVVHFPSRSNNNEKQDFRNQIMRNLRLRIDEILTNEPESKIILMGDLNGNPDDPFAKKILRTSNKIHMSDFELYNPMLNFKDNIGSLKHENQWILFDQIIFSKSFLNKNNRLQFRSAHIYQNESIQDWDKKFKGSPFRTFAGTKYLGGYSDHFPVYAILNY